MATASPSTPIADLRRQLERMESHGRTQSAVLPFGVTAVDERLPGGGLQLGHLHEVTESGPASEYAGLAALFAAGMCSVALGSKRLPDFYRWPRSCAANARLRKRSHVRHT
jgi:hypothetical protein